MADEPWKDFQQPQQVGQPAPPVANPNPAQAAVQDANAPWHDFADPAARAPAPVPEGWEVTGDTDRVGNRFARNPQTGAVVNIGRDPDTHDVTVHDPEHTTAGGAAWRGIQDAVPFIDYIAAGGNELGSALGMNDTDPNMSYADRVRALQQQRADSEAGDKAYHPVAHYGAEIGGLLGGGAALKGIATAGRLAPIVQGAAEAAPRIATAVGGGLTGALYGAGEADPNHVGAGAALGGGAGLVGGVVAPAIANYLSRPLSALLERTGVSGLVSGANRGVNMMLKRAPQDPAAVSSEIARFRSAGQEPTLLDVIDQSGRDTVAAANTKVPTERQATIDYSRQRAAALPTDAERLTQAHVTPSTMTSPDLRAQVATTQQALNKANYAKLDPQTVPLDDAGDIKDILNSPVGQQALAKARQGNADIAKQVGKLSSWAQTPEFDPALHLNADQKATLGQLTTIRDSATNPAIKQQMQNEIDKATAQFQSEWAATRPNAKPPTDVTYEAVDKVRKAARKLAKSAEGSNGTDTLGLPGDYGAVADTLDNHLSANIPGHDEAKATHGAYSRILNAIDGSGSKLAPGGGTSQPRINGSDLVDQGIAQRSEGNYQNFEPWARQLSEEQLPLHNANGTPILDRQGRQVTISQQDAAKLSAANAIRVRSQAPAPARSLMDNFTGNNAQDIKARALLGDTATDRLQAGMQASADRSRNAAELAGRGNSPTARLTNDAAGLGEDLHLAATVGHAATGNAIAALHGLGSMMRGQGLNPSDAADLVRRAVDTTPGAVDDFLAHLQGQGVSRARAQILLNVARRAASAGAAQATVPQAQGRTERTITLTGR